MTYGCHNRAPYKESLLVQDGYHQNTQSRIPKMVEIPSFAHGAECQYTHSDLGQADKGCYGCKWRYDKS